MISFKEKKGQGALEYLLLIGGVILVAVLVITLIVSLAGTGQEEAEAALTDAEINRGLLSCQTDETGFGCSEFCNRTVDPDPGCTAGLWYLDDCCDSNTVTACSKSPIDKLECLV